MRGKNKNWTEKTVVNVKLCWSVLSRARAENRLCFFKKIM